LSGDFLAGEFGGFHHLGGPIEILHAVLKDGPFMPVSIQPISRREFLQYSLALGAALALPRGVRAAMPTPICDHIALVSDVHVSGGLSRSMAERLSVAVDQVLAQRPQQVLVAGDCAYLSGGDGDYQEYIRRIQPLVDAGLPMHMTMGNHDRRDNFWEALPAEQAEANAALQRQSMVVPGRYANWFLLDSLDKTNHDAGELGADQLDWLAAELDARANQPALVMLHHDRVRNGKKGLLTDSEKLLDIPRPRRHVKAIFFGHTHIWDVAQDHSGLHLVNLPATGYTLWGRSFLGWANCRVYSDCATLQICTLDANAKENGQNVPLRWRPA
jgi:3',5'-cyclic-AMP phosphodiesterase